MKKYFTEEQKAYIRKAMEQELVNDVRMNKGMKEEMTKYVASLAYYDTDTQKGLDDYNFTIDVITSMLDKFWITYIEEGEEKARERLAAYREQQKREAKELIKKAREEQINSLMKDGTL